MTRYADPENHFAAALHISAVRHEDYDALSAAFEDIKRRFALGGSSVSIERVGERTVVHREVAAHESERSER